MIIDRVETLLGPQQAVVRVTTRDGLVGIGQTAAYEAGITTEVLHRLVAPLALGRSVEDAPRFAARVLDKQYKYFGTFLLRAICGVETAMWDALARAQGKPVHALLGPKLQDTVPVYASRLTRKTTPEQEVEQLEAILEQTGIRAIKIKVGERMGRNADAAPGRTERLVKLCAERFGGRITLMCDANSAYSAERAIEVGRLLQDHGFTHYEEPCRYDAYEETGRVAAALAITVAGGEQEQRVEAFRTVAERGWLDMLQPDVGYIGGFQRAREVADIAAAHGLTCKPHAPNSSLTQVFTMTLASVHPACGGFQEYRAMGGDQPWSEAIYLPMPVLKDGALRLPDGPGWGVTLNPDYERTAAHRELRA